MSGGPYVCVVDASVVAQLFVPEALTPQATALFALLTAGQGEFHAPDLLFAECANIFWKKAQRGVCTANEAELALANLLLLPLRAFPLYALAASALRLALTHNVSAYDACYVALAQQLAVPLITADQKLVQKLTAVSPPVIWLGAWVPPAGTTP